MAEILYQNTLAQRGNRYIIQIINRDAANFITLSFAHGEKIRELPVVATADVDTENFSAAEVFKEVIEAEERWVEDNR